MSMLDAPSRTHSAISLPVTGPRVSPIIACPVAMNKPGRRETGPTAGNPSGRDGLRPHHSDLIVASCVVLKYRVAAFVSCSRRGRLISWFTPDNSSVPAKRTNPFIGVQKTRFLPAHRRGSEVEFRRPSIRNHGDNPWQPGVASECRVCLGAAHYRRQPPKPHSRLSRLTALQLDAANAVIRGARGHGSRRSLEFRAVPLGPLRHFHDELVRVDRGCFRIVNAA